MTTKQGQLRTPTDLRTQGVGGVANALNTVVAVASRQAREAERIAR
jgi:hypothetical protein